MRETIIKARDMETKVSYLIPTQILRGEWFYVEKIHAPKNSRHITICGLDEKERELTLTIEGDLEVMVSVGYCDICDTQAPYLANTGGNILVCDTCTFTNERESR